ncbi:hypothetical protein HQ544_02185 [Candidatus Falkowbacteria bacterium]|nr:hypothetical protein [Candidatus Falkowbacteria bacterium]
MENQSQLTSDIRNTIILVVIFAAILVALYVIDLKTSYLTTLASRLMSGI